MTKMNRLNEKELNNVSGGFNPMVLIPLIPTIIDIGKKIFGKGDSKDNTQNQTQTQPTTVNNGPTFNNNKNNGNFNNNTTAPNHIASNNGNMNGNQTVA